MSSSPSCDLRQRIRRHLITALKLLIAAALIFTLFYYEVITLEALRTTFRDPFVTLLAFGIVFIGFVLNAVRWFLILGAMGINVRFRPCFEIFAMGAFANTFLPGGTGGDLVRAVYIARHVHQDRTGGVISVVADRALGLLSVIMVAVILGLSASDHVIVSPATRTFFYSLLVTLVFAIVGLVLALALASPVRFRSISQWIGMQTIVHRSILRLLETAMQLRTNPLALIASFFISLVLTFLVIVTIVFLSRGYEAGGLTHLDFANAAILSLLANALPFTPGGVGIAEGAFAFLCYAWELTPTALAYGSIFFGYRLTVAFVSLLGSAAFITYKRASA